MYDEDGAAMMSTHSPRQRRAQCQAHRAHHPANSASVSRHFFGVARITDTAYFPAPSASDLYSGRLNGSILMRLAHFCAEQHLGTALHDHEVHRCRAADLTGLHCDNIFATRSLP